MDMSEDFSADSDHSPHFYFTMLSQPRNTSYFFWERKKLRPEKTHPEKSGLFQVLSWEDSVYYENCS